MQEGCVSLGLVGARVGAKADKDEAKGWAGNKLGGTPVWLVVPEEDLTMCDTCAQQMAHLLQVNSSFDGSSYLRNTHVFVCLQCQSMTALRVMRPKHVGQGNNRESVGSKAQADGDSNTEDNSTINNTTGTKDKDDDKEATKDDNDWGSCDWGDDDDDDDDDDNNNDDDENLSALLDAALSKQKEACDLKKNTKGAHSHDDCDKDSVVGVVGKPLHALLSPWKVSFIDEPYSSDGDDVSGQHQHTSQLLEKYLSSGGTIGHATKADIGGVTQIAEEEYEEEVVHGDRTFDAYTSRLARCPEQVIRYNEGGALPLQQTDKVVIPACPEEPCPHCKHPLSFEMQLLPTLLDSIEPREVRTRLASFGAVVVYSCFGDCVVAGTEHKGCVVREHVIVTDAIE